MRKAVFDIQAINPWPRTTGIVSKIQQRASIQQDWMSNAPIVRRDLLRTSAGWRNAPDIQFVGQGALDEVNKCRIWRPQWKVRVETCGRSEDGPVFRSSIWRRFTAGGHEKRVSGPGRVVREPGAVA